MVASPNTLTNDRPTQDIHKRLERRIADFHGTQDAILFPSCFDANAGLFEALLTADDAVLSDALNHASIIDGVRLCKARRLRYAHLDMADLEAKLREADAVGARVKLIATDGQRRDGRGWPRRGSRVAAGGAQVGPPAHAFLTLPPLNKQCPQASFPWTATSRPCPTSWPWPAVTARPHLWMSATRRACWGPACGARTSTMA